MSKTKFKWIITILGLIIFISGIFITLDLRRFFIAEKEFKYDSSIYTYISKSLIVILTTVLVFMIGNDGLNKRDTNILKFTYIFIALADIALVLLTKPYLGIILFSIVQTALIIRNGAGMYNIIKNKGCKNCFGSLIINTILSLILLILILSNVLNNMIQDKALFHIMIFYAFLISSSLLTAISNMTLEVFPKLNSILVTIGMVFFMLCDLNVGLSMALNKGTIWLIADSVIWIFYTLALTLIALSGYSFETVSSNM
jgi:hypothetical protein